MTITVARLLDKNEFDVRFVVIGNAIGEIGKFIPGDYEVSLIKVRNIFDLTAQRTYRYLKPLNPQFVFCSLVYLAPHVIKAVRRFDDCRIIIRWNCAVNRVSGITKTLVTQALPRAHVIIAQTETMQEEIESAFPKTKGKVVTLHNLIDKETIESRLNQAENPYPDGTDKKIVWIGRFDPVKCIEVLIEAFAIAYRSNGNIRLYLVGKNDGRNAYYQSIKRMAEALGVEKKIHFVGFQDNPYKWMKYADCLALSSRSEASPNTLFEALYLGVPAVSTRCTPNVDDIIQDGENGYKVNVGDAAAMADALLRAIDLKYVKTTYKHSAPEDFIRLFS